MIQGIFIIDNRGICIISRKYGSIEIDENLIGGFLTAILRFSSKLIQGEDDESLQEILLRNYRVLYEPRDTTTVVAVVGREDKEELVREVLGKILDTFIKNFGTLLQSWDGNVQPFIGFEIKIDEILVESGAGELILSEPVEATPKTPSVSLKQIFRRSSKVFMFKTILAGDKKVGKTSIVKKATENKFPPEYAPTIGCNFAVKQLEAGKNRVRLHFWDLGGSANFEQMRKELYIDADLAILVFDLTNPESFKNLEKWRWEIYNSFGSLQLMVVIGNKSDLERKISSEDCLKYAQGINAPYFETSAKLGTNIDEVFKSVAELLLKKEQETK
nr:GTP-binding protein [Candidatus Freyarchaeota archaeon]